jgi:hypothetical protein
MIRFFCFWVLYDMMVKNESMPRNVLKINQSRAKSGRSPNPATIGSKNSKVAHEMCLCRMNMFESVVILPGPSIRPTSSQHIIFICQLDHSSQTYSR